MAVTESLIFDSDCAANLPPKLHYENRYNEGYETEQHRCIPRSPLANNLWEFSWK